MNKDRILINKLKTFENFNSNVVSILLVLFGTILLAISAKIQLPFWPVPMTMQTFVIFLIGMTYSVRLSFATVLFYLFQGAIGLPVFAAGGGVAYLVGPTAGYLYGMLFASIVISYLANLGFSKTYFKATVSLLIGSTIIFSKFFSLCIKILFSCICFPLKIIIKLIYILLQAYPKNLFLILHCLMH